MKATMTRQQMNWHWLTFRTEIKAKDSNETATISARKGTRVWITKHPRRRQVTRISTVRREAETQKLGVIWS